MLSIKKAKKYSTKLINTGVIDEMSSLDAIRQKYVNVINYLLLIPFVGLGISNTYLGESVNAILCLFGIIIYATSIYFSYKKRMEASITITCTFLNVILFTAFYFQLFEPIEIIPHLIYSISGTLFLLPNKEWRMVYITICSVLLTVIVFQYNYKLDKTIPTLIQVITSIIIHYFFMLFVESQDHKLNKTVLELESSNSDIERLNDFLTIKNQEITTFSHIMTHDLKAPLDAINSFANLISEKVKFDSSKEKKYFSFIKSSSKSMQLLIDDLLQYMRIENFSSYNNPIDLNDSISEVIADFQFELNGKKIAIHKDRLPIVNGNQQLIKTTFHNLISNSIKYQPKNSTNHTPSIQIRAEDTGNYYHIIFKDNGIGIKKTNIPNLFEPFKRFHNTSEYKGTGLGLSICKRAMEKMKGMINLTHTSDQGTEFKITFRK